MTYVLEKIQPADVQRILQDVERDRPPSHAHFGDRYFKYPDLAWSIDRARDMYLVNVPNKAWPVDGDEYLFYFNGMLHEFCLKGGMWFGKLVSFPSERSSSIITTEFKEELKAAFAAHGRYGRDPQSRTPEDAWSDVVAPEFQETEDKGSDSD